MTSPYLRLASTTDGINFTDLGALQGLKRPHDCFTSCGTRWLATAGTVLRLEDGRYGLLFSRRRLRGWRFRRVPLHRLCRVKRLVPLGRSERGINNPIISTSPVTLTVNAMGVPATGSGTQSVTIPANPAVVGNTQGFFAGRVYAPSATSFDHSDITVIFAGYHTQRPKNGLGDYRTIGRVSLHASQPVSIGDSKFGDSDEDR